MFENKYLIQRMKIKSETYVILFNIWKLSFALTKLRIWKHRIRTNKPKGPWDTAKT